MRRLLTRWAQWIGRDVSVFTAGAVVGFVVAAARTANRRERTASAGGGSEGRRRFERAWEETLEGLASVWERGRPRPVVDVESLSRILGVLPGGGSMDVYSLAPGIVELVGTASDERGAARLIAAAEAHPGVTAVVNRIWITPLGQPPESDSAHANSGGAMPGDADTGRATPGDADPGDESPV
jgi:hypothetical protein